MTHAPVSFDCPDPLRPHLILNMPRPLSVKPKEPAEVTVLKLDALLDQLCVPSNKDAELADSIFQRAAAYHQTVYGSAQQFVRNLQSRDHRVDSAAGLTIVSGLAGAGKTQLMTRLCALIGSHTTVEVSPLLGAIRCTPAVYQRIHESTSVRAALLGLTGTEVAPRMGPSLKQLRDDIARLLFRRRCALIVLDELQHLTLSANANSRLTELLLSICQLGPPVIVTCNYSMLHRLDARNQEDKQRLMSDVRFLDPVPPDTEDWGAYCGALDTLLNNIIDFSFAKASQAFWELCAGLRRVARMVIVRAYRCVRAEGRKRMQLSDLRAAYVATGFAGVREDVEHLLSRGFSDPRLPMHLRPPGIKSSDSVLELNRAVDTVRQNRITAEVVRSTLTPAERAHVEATRSTAAQTGPSKTKAGRKPRRPQSVEEFAAG